MQDPPQKPKAEPKPEPKAEPKLEPKQHLLIQETPKQEMSSELLDIPSEVIAEPAGITETDIPSEVL